MTFPRRLVSSGSPLEPEIAFSREQALQEAGASLADVVRTRVMLTDIGRWRDAGRAHTQRFAQVRPACTFIEVSRFIDPEWLVQFEVDAIVRA